MTIIKEIIIEKYGENGEKTGWCYIILPPNEIRKIYTKDKKSFRVKGLIDSLSIEKTALLPAKDGHYILPINAKIRKAIRKNAGQKVHINFSCDTSILPINNDLTTCLEMDQSLKDKFEKRTKAEQHYLNKWVNESKTTVTLEKRITSILKGLENNAAFQNILKYNS